MMGNETRRDRKMGGKEAGKLPREGNDTIVKRRKKKKKKKRRRKDCNESRGGQTRVKLATSLFLLSRRRKRKTRRCFLLLFSKYKEHDRST